MLLAEKDGPDDAQFAESCADPGRAQNLAHRFAAMR
jgi:hypothetical protein